MSDTNPLRTIDVLSDKIRTLRRNIQSLSVSSMHETSLKTSLKTQTSNISKQRQPNSKILQENLQPISPPQSAKDKINERFQKLKEELAINPNNFVAVETWVGDLMRISVQEAHKEHFEKDDQNSMRLRFATLILDQYNKFIIYGSKVEGIQISQLQKIFKNASGNAIEYLQYKYETKKNKVSDIKLTEQIKQTQKLIDPHFDLLRRSGTTLPIHSQKQLRRTIKQFLNKLIVQCQQNYQGFKKQMIDVFNSNGNSDLHYQIGAKIRMSTKPYTQEELKQPGFFVKGNEMMRVMMKWIEELLDFFQTDSRIKNNKGGFRINGQNQMKKLVASQAIEMWDKFLSESKNLKKALNLLRKDIQSIISSIIIASQNDIKKIQSIDKNIINLLIVSDNIWKALENYMMDTLVIIFRSFRNIKRNYEEQMKMESDLQIFTFMLGDLFRCKCSGTREQILTVFRNLKEKEKRGQMIVLRVKNRLNQSTNDFLINFAYVDPSKSFLICQMQLALAKSANNDDRAYHFKHFLYEMARSPHGVGVELAVMLYYLDNRKHYLKKHGLMLQAPINMFIYDEASESLVCKECFSNTTIVQNKKNSYMCHNCCKLIQGYTYCFDAQQCENCKHTICPLCYLKLRKFENSSEFMLNGLPSLERYFTPKKIYLQENVHVILKEISELVSEHQFVAVLYFKKHSGVRQMEILKRIPSTNYYAKTFSNQPFKIEKQLINTIALILVPKLPPCIITKENYLEDIKALKNARSLVFQSNGGNIEDLQQYFKYEVIDSYLHENFDFNSKKAFVVLKNLENSKSYVVDYNMEEILDMQKYIADNEVKQIINKINKSNSSTQSLILVNLETPELLECIIKKQSIIEIQIQESLPKQSQIRAKQYSILSLFPKVTSLAVFKTPSYNKHIEHSFDNSLQQLTIKHCNLRNQGIARISYPHLVKLDLSHNFLTEIPHFQLPEIQNMSLANNEIVSMDYIKTGFNKLNRIILKQNKINQLPILDLPSLEQLNLNYNQIESFENVSFFKTPKLSDCYLSNNETLNEKVFPNINNLENLTNLYLSNSNLTKVEFSSHPVLRTLKLDHNLLTEISFTQMPKLSVLDLSFNKIPLDVLLPLIHQLQLDVLQIYGNRLLSFPSIKSKISSIKVEADLFKNKESIIVPVGNSSSTNLTERCTACNKIITELTMLYNDKMKHTFCNKECIDNFNECVNAENEFDTVDETGSEFIQLINLRIASNKLIN